MHVLGIMQCLGLQFKASLFKSYVKQPSFSCVQEDCQCLAWTQSKYRTSVMYLILVLKIVLQAIETVRQTNQKNINQKNITKKECLGETLLHVRLSVQLCKKELDLSHLDALLIQIL